MVSFRSFVRGHILPAIPTWLSRGLTRAYYARAAKRIPEDRLYGAAVVKALVKAGDSVIDLGANIGVYTRFLSRLVGADGRVFSIEPVPSTFDLLCFNVRRLGLRNVVPLNYAASDAEGIVSMSIPLLPSGAENFYVARIVESESPVGGIRVPVEAKTLDAILSDQSADIAFIKCDVEGHELKCAQGAQMIIEKSKPAWCIELSGNPDQPGSSAGATVQHLVAAGYTVCRYDGQRLHERRPGDKSTDYFFLTAQHLCSLADKGL